MPGFALPMLYKFCEFFQIEYAIGIPANCVFQRRAEPRQKQLKSRYRRTQVPQRSFSSFRHRARRPSVSNSLSATISARSCAMISGSGAAGR